MINNDSLRKVKYFNLFPLLGERQECIEAKPPSPSYSPILPTG